MASRVNPGARTGVWTAHTHNTHTVRQHLRVVQVLEYISMRTCVCVCMHVRVCCKWG